MTDADYQVIEINKEGVRILLEFPKKSEEEEVIRQEVKAILSDTLQNYLHKFAGGNQKRGAAE